MPEEPVGCFPLVEQYLGIRMGLDFSALTPGRVAVVESPRRVQRTKGYGYVRALWWIWLVHGRTAASVPPGAGDAVREVLAGVQCAELVHDPEIRSRLEIPANESLWKAGLEEVNRAFRDICFACDSSLLRRHGHGDCRRLTDESVPPGPGLRLPTHCFPDGIAYGVVADGKAVSIAFAHRSGVMEGRVADLGVETSAEFRRRGYAKTVVSAVVEHVIRNGGEAYYVCRPDNHASIATARSVGFAPYGRSLILGAPAPDVPA